jgi:precorrin-6B methylase 1
MKNGSNGNSGKGQLIVVGTGLRTVGHVTAEAVAWIRAADKVLYVVGDPVSEKLIHDLNPGAESLEVLYKQSKARIDTYRQMVERILTCVRQGYRTCAVFYGHPGVFVYPSHEAVRQARIEGYPAVMLPGVSAEDCLFADIGIDPAQAGCQSFEATDFLFHDRRTDPSSSLVLWQIGVLGNEGFNESGRYDLSLMPLLITKLLRLYPPMHQAAVYEAATQIGCPPRISWTPIPHLTQVEMSAASTLFIPPGSAPRPDAVVVHQAGAFGPAAWN